MSGSGEEIRKLVTRAQIFTSSGEHDRAAAQWQEVMAVVLKANALEPNRDYVRPSSPTPGPAPSGPGRPPGPRRGGI